MKIEKYFQKSLIKDRFNKTQLWIYFWKGEVPTKKYIGYQSN